MKHLIEKIKKAWSVLLNQKSKNYLLRSKIDQNIAITNSNLTASFRATATGASASNENKRRNCEVQFKYA